MDPQQRGDLAESLVPVAEELAFLVRDEGREAIGDWLDAHGILEDQARALLVVLAAMVPIDATSDVNLSWLTFDEEGRPLERTIPLLPCLPAPAGPAVPVSLSLEVPEQPAAGIAIRRARNQAGMSQRAFAREVGVAHRTFRAWEAGEQEVRRPNWVAVQLVAGSLGVAGELAARRAGADGGQQQGEAAA